MPLLPPAEQRPAASAPCPCGAGQAYGRCCGPLVDDGVPSASAEALMRSRYTAYAVGSVAHIERTWHPRTRPADVTLDPGLQWTGLDVDAVTAGGPEDTEGVVEFRAHWVAHQQRGVIHERSSFARPGGRWVYVEGTTL